MRVQVEVTQTDINRGCREHSIKCPIARALRRTIPGIDIEVGTYYLYSYDGVVTTLLPKKVTKFIQHFDAGEKVEPFTFELDVDEWKC